MSEYIVEKDWFYKGLRCVVIMGHMGHRCGYVGVDETHSLYGIKYQEEIEISEDRKKAFLQGEVGKRGAMSLLSFGLNEKIAPEILFDVHGGITFSDGDKAYPVESDLWWFGYDCGHAGDGRDLSVLPEETRKIYEKYPISGEVLRSLEYCIKECESLADQLIDYKMEITEKGLCEGCGREASKELHTCPFKEDINGDSETLCNCCDQCMEQCAQDI